MVRVSNPVRFAPSSSPANLQRTLLGFPTVGGSISSQPKFFRCSSPCAASAIDEATQPIDANKHAATLPFALGTLLVKILPAKTPAAKSTTVNIPRQNQFHAVLGDCQRKSLISLPPIRRSNLHAQTILAANGKEIPPFRPALPQRHGHVEQPAPLH